MQRRKGWTVVTVGALTVCVVCYVCVEYHIIIKICPFHASSRWFLPFPVTFAAVSWDDGRLASGSWQSCAWFGLRFLIGHRRLLVLVPAPAAGRGSLRATPPYVQQSRVCHTAFSYAVPRGTRRCVSSSQSARARNSCSSKRYWFRHRFFFVS